MISRRTGFQPRAITYVAATVTLVLALFLVANTTSTASPAPDWPAESAPSRIVTSPRSTVALVSWQPVIASAGYVVDVARNPQLANPERRQVAEPMVILTELSPKTTYYVRVAAIDTLTGSPGPPSPVVSLTTTGSAMPYAPPDPDVSSPTSTTVLARWKAPGAGLSYEAQIATENSMRGAATTRVNDPQTDFEDLVADTKYFVRVRALSSSGLPASGWSAAQPISTSSQAPLRVASFNVKCETCGGTSWTTRRGVVAASIREQDPDVIGIQEASQGWLAGRRISQFEDLANRLGDAYRLANSRRNNCVKHWTPSGCRYRDQGASQGTKIIYNSERVELLDQGSRRLYEANSGSNDRYVAWAIFRQVSTGKKFFFADTHLEPNASFAGRNRQTRQVLATIKANNPDKLPTIVVGDFNSHKWTKPANGPYDIMRAAGFVDPLGNTYRSTTRGDVGVVERRINTRYSSYNDYKRQAPRFSYTNGTYLDYIFTTKMRVSEWETVIDADSRGRITGVIPSDHNMIRATVWLP